MEFTLSCAHGGELLWRPVDIHVGCCRDRSLSTKAIPPCFPTDSSIAPRATLALSCCAALFPSFSLLCTLPLSHYQSLIVPIRFVRYHMRLTWVLRFPVPLTRRENPASRAPPSSLSSLFRKSNLDAALLQESALLARLFGSRVER